MRDRRGFSLLEVLYCLAIISIVAAILTPVFRRAKHSAQVTSSLSNLHQFYVALMLYQAGQGETGQYGSLAQMGLPTVSEISAVPVPLALWKSPCTRNPQWCPVPITDEYEYYASTSVTPWEEAVANYQDNAILMTDMNCADHDEPLLSDFIPHQGLGVRLSGTVVNLQRPGDYTYEKWWQ